MKILSNACVRAIHAKYWTALADPRRAAGGQNRTRTLKIYLQSNPKHRLIIVVTLWHLSCTRISLNFAKLRSPVTLSNIEGHLCHCHLTTLQKHEISRDRFAECIGMRQCILYEVSVVDRACPSCVKEQILYGTKQIFRNFAAV